MKRYIFCSLLVVAFQLSAQKIQLPYVVLVSFDGFRHDYVQKFNPPTFQNFINHGSSAKALIPSFPSKTFPNHYTIVTGLTPGHHGLVDNSFYDATRNANYGMRALDKVVDGYYYGGIPIWQLAKQHGIKTASYFWVGSEISEDARRPDYYYPFNDTINPMLKVNQVIDWLNLPEPERPHLITLYFSSPDHEGHDFGPWGEETKNAVLRADTLLLNLLKGIESTKLPVNVILVSDHGMYEILLDAEHSIFMDELLNRKDRSVKYSNGGTQLHVYVSSQEKKDSVYNVLKQSEKNFKVYLKKDLPDRWHYQHERVGDILVEAKPGYYIRGGTREQFNKAEPIGEKRGVHGYDPAITSEVHGIFYAQGPNIKSGITIEPFQNIHIYPLIARILNLPLPPIDGDPNVLKMIYKRQ